MTVFPVTQIHEISRRQRLSGFLFFLAMVVVASIAVAGSNSGATSGKPKPWKPSDGISVLHIRGSSTFFSTIQEMAEEFMTVHPGSLIVVSSGGTTRGIKAIMDGTVDIAMTSSIISDEQKKTSEERQIKLTETVVARGAVVPLVHPSNPVKDLSMEQLKQIFVGHISNWNQVGGPKLAIQVVSNDFTRGAFETWRRCVMGKNVIISSQAITLEPPDPLKLFIGTTPGAIGYISFIDVDPSVKAISVNGVSVNTSSVSDGTFPIRRDHTLITREMISDLAKSFIQFAVDPNRGQKIVIKHHLAPNAKPVTKEVKVEKSAEKIADQKIISPKRHSEMNATAATATQKAPHE
jgi:phosphate transport system substrate-binding protein